ncbi:unnamed protein product, partial [Heterotrigona itama]
MLRGLRVNGVVHLITEKNLRLIVSEYLVVENSDCPH